MAEPIRIVIADKQTVLRRGLAATLHTCSSFELVGEASSAREVLELGAQQRPDLILMDILLPDMDGEQVIRALHRQSPRTRVLVLTSFVSAGVVRLVLGAGARGYLLKSIERKALIAAIQHVKAGQIVLMPEAERALLNALQHPSLSPNVLTGREREVLALMAHGKTNAEIAEHLTVSVFTVKKHVSRIFNKLQTSNRRETVALAVQHQLVLDWYVPV